MLFKHTNSFCPYWPYSLGSWIDINHLPFNLINIFGHHCGRCGFDPRVGKIPWRRKWQPTLVRLPGKSHGRRSRLQSTGWQRVRYDWVTSLSLSFSLNTVNTSFICCVLHLARASLVAQLVKNLPAMQENWVWSRGQEDALEKGLATHSSTLAWEFHGQRSRTGCNPQNLEESDTTVHLTFTFHLLK